MFSGWYMASTSLIPPEYDSTMGAILTTSSNNNHGIPSRLSRGVYWCLDNGVFTGKFSELAWKKKLDSLLPFKKACLFIAIPDVVANCDATLKQFSYYRKMVLDFPVALVSQDGISKVPEKIPWDDFDCIFIGGSDEHKLGKEAWWTIEQAKKHNKWVHVGRVNSISRMSRFYMADSWDGTHLGFFPSDVSKFHNAVLRIRNRKTMKGFFDENYQKNSYDGDYLGTLLRSDRRTQSN